MKIAPAIFATVFVAFFTAGPAFAQNAQSWVARAGLDSNPCTVSQPCKTLQHAHDQTNTGGQVNVAGPGEYGPLVINRNIAVVNDSGGDAVLTSASTVVRIDDPTASVTLRGLTIDGRGTDSFGIAYSPAVSNGILVVEKCIIRNFAGAGSGSGFGLLFQPVTQSKLVVVDSSFLNNGVSTAGGGIKIAAVVNGTANAVLERVTMSGNTAGVVVDGSNSAATNVTIADSLVSGSSLDAVSASSSPSAGTKIMITGARFVNNAGAGVRATGAAVTVRVDTTTVAANGTGLAAAGGSTIATYGNNNLDGNGTNGTFSGTVALK